MNNLEAVNRPQVGSPVGVAFPVGSGGVSNELRVWRWADANGVTTVAAAGATGAPDITQCAGFALVRPCLLVGGPSGYVVGTADDEVTAVAASAGGDTINVPVSGGLWVLNPSALGAAAATDLRITPISKVGATIPSTGATETAAVILSSINTPVPKPGGIG